VYVYALVLSMSVIRLSHSRGEHAPSPLPSPIEVTTARWRCIYVFMWACVCVYVYLLNTDKSSLSLRLSTPPIVITTAAPRHVLRHYRTVLVPPLLPEKNVLPCKNCSSPPPVDHVRKSIFHEHHHRDKPNPIHQNIIRTTAVAIYI